MYILHMYIILYVRVRTLYYSCLTLKADVNCKPCFPGVMLSIAFSFRDPFCLFTSLFLHFSSVYLLKFILLGDFIRIRKY